MHLEHEHHILYRSLRILEGACAALFLFMVFVLAMFLLGNYQEFLDSSQKFLLATLQKVSLLCALVSLYYLVALIVWMAWRKHLLVFRALFSLVSLALSVAFSLGTNFVEVLLAPVIGR